MWAFFGGTTLMVFAATALAQEPDRTLPPRVRTTVSAQLPLPVPDLPPPRTTQPLPPGKPEKTEALQREMERLRKERAALHGERSQADKQHEETGGALPAETTLLRVRLAELLLKMTTRGPASSALEVRPTKPAPKGAEPPPAAEPKPRGEPPTVEVKPVDPQSLADSLYRAGDFESALAAYRLLEAGKLERDEQIFVKYMSGCCLYHLEKLDDAIAAWREVGSAREGPFLASIAQWQIGGVRWRRDLEQHLQQLRQRRAAVEAKR